MAFNENKPVTNSLLNSTEIRENFKHLKGIIAKEHTWSDNDAESSKHNLDEIFLVVSGSTQDELSGGARISGVTKGDWLNFHKTSKGVSGDRYSIQKLLQELVDRSHQHSLGSVSFNCNCNCNCGGNN